VNSSNNYRAKSLNLINGFVCYYGYLEMENFKNMPLLEDLVIYIPMLNSRVSRHFVASQKHLKKLAIFLDKQLYLKFKTFNDAGNVSHSDRWAKDKLFPTILMCVKEVNLVKLYMSLPQ
jgi:hypothetical protein